MKKWMALLMATVMVLCSLAGCSSDNGATSPASAGDPAAPASVEDAAPAGSARDTIVVGVPAPPVYLDPHIQTSTATNRVVMQIYDRLTYQDEDLNVVPMLAESWDVIDEKTTRYNLRAGVKFHNGETMTSEDVKYSIERCMASDGTNYNFLIIDKVEIIDELTIDITTKQPFNVMPGRFALEACSIVNKKAAESDEDFNTHPVGTGPFKLSSWTVDGDVVLEAHEDYWRGAPAIDTLIFRAIPEESNRTIGLETGEIDIAFDISHTDAGLIESNPDLNLLTKQSNKVMFLGYCVEDEILSNVKVRQALSHAVNKEDLVEIVYSGSANVAHNTMVCDLLFGYAPDTVVYEYDLDKAKDLLAEAGYPDGFSTTLTVLDTQEYQTAAVVIQDQLRKIGVEVEVQTMNNAAFLDYVAEGSQSLYMYDAVRGDTDSMLRTQYHSSVLGRGGNRHRWTDPRVDEAIDTAASSLDDDERLALYEEVQTILAENVPQYPLAIPYVFVGTQGDIAGFKIHTSGTPEIYGTYVEAQ